MHKSISSVLLTATLLTLAACGGGGGSSSSVATPAQFATVGIALTDAPTTDVDQVLATITSIEVLGGSKPVVLFSGVETVDLLRLADYSELFAVSNEVPAGTYSKIRLHLSNLELVKLNGDGPDDDEIIDAKLVANGKMDLNPQGPFRVAAGETLVITLDFDMKKSLKITETGNGRVIVRPVIFVDIANGLPAPKLTRIHGEIAAIDATGQLRLCQTALTSSAHESTADRRHGDGDGRCVFVGTNDATGIFGADGLPQDYSQLAVGDEATIVGRLRPRIHEDVKDRYEDFRQASSKDSKAGDNEDSNDDDNADKEDGNYDGDHFAVDAYIIEQGPVGTFRRLAGVVTAPVNVVTDRFELDVGPGQGLVTDGPLAAQLYPKSRIFSSAGIELGRQSLETGTRAMVDSVLVVSGANEDVLRTALVVLNTDLGTGEILLHGTVLNVSSGTNQLIMSTDSGDRCVNTATADVFLVDDSGGSLETTRGSLADLQVGQTINAFGEEGVGGCLLASTILARL